MLQVKEWDISIQKNVLSFRVFKGIFKEVNVTLDEVEDEAKVVTTKMPRSSNLNRQNSIESKGKRSISS